MSASKNLSKELYALSNWDGDQEFNELASHPEYTADYLLAKLPTVLRGTNSRFRTGHLSLAVSIRTRANAPTVWIASYGDDNDIVVSRRTADGKQWYLHNSADTPANALCKLASLLIQHGEIQP